MTQEDCNHTTTRIIIDYQSISVIDKDVLNFDGERYCNHCDKHIESVVLAYKLIGPEIDHIIDIEVDF